MAERKIANYFDVVDLVDKVLPPKEEEDYTKQTEHELVNRIRQAMEESGFYFTGEQESNVRGIIVDCFKNVFGRKTNYVGGSGEGFDQRNYYIQNCLSDAKNRLIHLLTDTKFLLSGDNGIFNQRLGTSEELRPRMSRKNVEEYVRSVLTNTWEDGLVNFDEYILARDILLHFGIKPENGMYSLYSSEIFEKVSKMIANLEFASKDVYGPFDSEGYGNRAETNRERHPKLLDDTINRITDYIYAILKDTLDRTETRENRMAQAEAQAAMQRGEEPRVATPLVPSDPVKKPFEGGIDKNKPEQPLVATPLVPSGEGQPKEIKGVSVEELEATRAKYEEVQAIMAENVRLVAELESLSKQIDEIQEKLNKNNEIITKRLGYNNK